MKLRFTYAQMMAFFSAINEQYFDSQIEAADAALAQSLRDGTFVLQGTKQNSIEIAIQPVISANSKVLDGMVVVPYSTEHLHVFELCLGGGYKLTARRDLEMSSAGSDRETQAQWTTEGDISPALALRWMVKLGITATT